MADASYPDDLLYHPEHDWVRLDGDTATFGITWFAQDALGEVVFFEPPEVGSTVSKDEPYAEVESVKAVSDVIAPLSGEIVEVNTALSGKGCSATWAIRRWPSSSRACCRSSAPPSARCCCSGWCSLA